MTRRKQLDCISPLGVCTGRNQHISKIHRAVASHFFNKKQLSFHLTDLFAFFENQPCYAIPRLTCKIFLCRKSAHFSQWHLLISPLEVKVIRIFLLEVSKSLEMFEVTQIRFDGIHTICSTELNIKIYDNAMCLLMRLIPSSFLYFLYSIRFYFCHPDNSLLQYFSALSVLFDKFNVTLKCLAYVYAYWYW